MNLIYNLLLNTPVIISIAALMMISAIVMGYCFDKVKNVRINFFATKLSDILFVGTFVYIAACVFARSINYIVNSWV